MRQLSNQNTTLTRSVPWLTLVVALVLTVIAGFSIQRIALTKETSQFNDLTLRTAAEIKDSFNTYIAILRSTQGLYAVNPRLTTINFRQFTKSFDLRNRYPGIQAIAFSQRFFPDNTDGTIRTRIVNIEPLDDRNRAALGYDMYTEPVRRVAMDRAWQTGNPSATHIVTLKQEIDENRQPGMLMYLPVYKDNASLQNIEDRRRALVGFVYFPFRLHDLVGGIIDKSAIKGLGVVVYDGKIGPEQLIFESEPEPRSVIYTKETDLDIGGLQWKIRFFSGQDFGFAFERQLVPFVFGVGSFLSILLYLVTRTQIEARFFSDRIRRKLEESQEALRQSQQRYQLVVENASDLINVLDMEGNYLFVSPAYKQILGYEPSELTGKAIFSIVHPEDIKLVKKQIVFASKSKPKRAIYRLKHKNGHYLYIEGIRTVIEDNQNKPFLMVSVARDVTDRLQLDKRKDDFISIASHELRTPLTSLKLYTQLLMSKFQKKPVGEELSYLLKMNNQINKMARMISDLLDVSRIESGKIVLKIEPVKLEKIVKESAEDLQKGVKHKIVVHGKLTGEAYGDKQRLTQVVGNLLSNAVKYSPQANKIDVYLANQDNQLVVKVQDYGVGIEKENLKKIFEKFYQTTRTSRVAATGLGLGLYISAEIIRRHHGKIWAESELGKGSSFYFSLPVAITS